MKISHGWVSEFVQLDPTVWNADKISTTLTDLGLEVEHVDDQAASLNRFVVGYVAECTKHPKADKLSVCRVDAGESELRTIVCGAANVAAGQFVAVALDGAIVPNGGFEISKRMLRGVESNGMICSFAELHIPGNSDGIWILATKDGIDVIPRNEGATLVVGMPLAEYLGKTDVIYDVFITPNRADCLSHIGIAREILAYQVVHENSTALPIETPLENSQQSSLNEVLSTEFSQRSSLIESVNEVLAPVYFLQKIENVKITDSPAWMQERLLAVGIRPRNIVVDVTNYVNMELGQPLHAFDYKKVRGSKLQVQKSAECRVQSAEFVTLDGKSRSIPGDALMICDMEGPIAVAGVMGGQNTEIDINTTDVVLESAFFNPTSIRRTARNLGLNTDASYRFERGVDIGNVEASLERATQLIIELCPESKRGELSFRGTRNVERGTVTVRYDKMRSINGIDVENNTMLLMFEALCCEVLSHDNVSCTLRIPTWRVDLLTEIDMAEEVMRLYGINNIPSAETANVSLNKIQHSKFEFATRYSLFATLRRLLAARGYSDCITGSLTSPEHGSVKLKNALGLEYSAMRSSMVPSLLGVAAMNLRHGARTVRLSEIGNTYEYKVESAERTVSGMPTQKQMLTLLVCGSAERHWSSAERAFDLYDLLGDLGVIGQIVLRPGTWNSQHGTTQGIEIMAGAEVIGRAYQLDPAPASSAGVDVPVFVAEILMSGIDAMQVTANEQRVYKKVGLYPSVKRDLALVVDESVTAGQLMQSIWLAAPEICRDVQVFDVYRDEKHVGAGRKSIAVTLTFRDDEKTLVDEEVERFIRTIISAAAKELGAHVRGGE